MLKVEGAMVVLFLMEAFIVHSSLEWEMPSPQFLEAFALKFKTDGIRVALPEDNFNRQGILPLMKHFR